MVRYSLVGYDGSETSQRAVRFALDLARAGQGKVRVVSVLQVSSGGADTCALMMTDSPEQRLAELWQELRGIDAEAEQWIDLELTHGSPGDVLLNQVRQHAIDHVVIGHTGRGTLARWLLGSVSDDVLSGAHVPVTVVR